MALKARVAGLIAGLVERRLGSRGRRDFREWSSYWSAPWAWRGRTGDDDVSPFEARWLSATQRCVALLSDVLAATPLRIVRREEGGGRTPITNTDASRLISELDFVTKESLFSSMLLAGNGYARIIKNDRGGAFALQPMPPGLVQVAVSETGEIWYRFGQDPVTRRAELDLPADQVLHLKYRVGQGAHDLLGTPPLALCAKSMGFVTRVTETGTALYRNAAIPTMALTTDAPLTKAQTDDLRGRWKEVSGGDAYGGTAILSNGLRPVALPAEKIVELQLAELHKVSVAEISRAYGVPLQLLNETSSLNYSTSVELQRSFATFTLLPLGQRVADALSLALLSREERLSGIVVQYDFSSLLLGSGQELAEFASKLVNGGVSTVNEMRDLMGLPDIAEGGVLRVPVNSAPLPAWAAGKVGAKTNGSGAPALQ